MSPPAPMTAADELERLASIRETTRRFAEDRIGPVAAALDEAESFPAELYSECAELGLFGIIGARCARRPRRRRRCYAAVMEELSRGYASVADQCGLIELIGTLLSSYGTHAQIERYLKPTLLAEAACAYALTEAEAGSIWPSLRTTARRDGDGWRLTGEKLWIHNAPIARFCAGARAHRSGSGPSRHEHFHRRPATSPACSRGRRSTRWASARPRSARCLRRCSPAGRRAARPGGPRLSHHDERARQGPRRDRRVGRRHRPGGAGGSARLRQDAPPVRPGDRRVPGHPVDARRHGQGHARGSAAGPCRGRTARPRRTGALECFDREVLRRRRGGGAHGRTRCRSSAAAATSAASRSSGCIATPRSRRSTRAPTRSSGCIIARQLLGA